MMSGQHKPLTTGKPVTIINPALDVVGMHGVVRSVRDITGTVEVFLDNGRCRFFERASIQLRVY